MAIKPRCDRCGEELAEFGAILLSPLDAKGKVQKFHICKTCYQDMAKNLINS